jgi:hypothetical protein
VIPVYDFFHSFNSPTVRVFSGCSEFQVIERVISADSILVMDCESLIAKPKDRITSHRMLFVKRKPMFMHATSLSQWMSFHTPHDNVASRRFCRMPDSVLCNPVRHCSLLDATSAKAAKPFLGIGGFQDSDEAARRALDRDTPLKGECSTGMTQMIGATHLSGGFVLVSSDYPRGFAVSALYRPFSIAVCLFCAWWNAQQKRLKLWMESARGLIRHNESISFCLAALGWLQTDRVLRLYQGVL